MRVSLIKRLKAIVIGGASRILISLSNVIISFVVIRTQSPGLWGEIVIYLLFIDFGFSFVSWGSTPYLIREFSLHPANIKFSWGQSFSSRSIPLAFFLIVILFLQVDGHITFTLMAWIVARYFYQSFESFVQYDRHFLFSFVVEMIGLSIVVLPVITARVPMMIEPLIFLLAAGTVCKAFISTIFFWKQLSFRLPSKTFYIQAFPFLLLTFSAMAQQRSDLYCVAYFLSKTEVARYQIFINLLIFAQFLASLLVSPFAKNIFRLPYFSFLKLERQFALSGILWAAASAAGVYVLTHFFYRLEFSIRLFGLGYLYILMFYLYLLRNYLLGKQNRQLLVAMYSFTASGINMVMSLVLTPRFGLEGALTASLMAQVLLVALYHQKIIFVNAPR